MKNTDNQRPFIEKAASDTRAYLQSLLDENQRLSRTVAELETAVAQRETSEQLLQQRLDEIEEESRRFAERYVEVEQQNTNLANLYVASYQLNGTLDRERIIQAIQEIIINLIGCEEFAVWELDDELGALVLTGSFGIDASRWACLTLDSGLIGAVASTGDRFIAADAGSAKSIDHGLTACIPLKLDDRVVGAIAIFRLLQQKQGLDPVDFELFDLLASHAATSLVCTRSTVAAAAGQVGQQ